MALTSSALGGEIGLRLLLSPVSSSIVVRAASVAFGLGFPVYLSFKALEKKCQAEQEQWLVYWAVYGCFNVVERISDKLISWFPLYHHAKLAFLLWLQLPNNYGVRHLFFKYMRPFLLKHQSRLDRVVDGSRNDMNNFITSQEIQAVGQVAKKIAVSAYKTAEQTVRSTRTLYSNTASIETSDDHPPVSRQLSTEDPWALGVLEYPLETHLHFEPHGAKWHMYCRGCLFIAGKGFISRGMEKKAKEEDEAPFEEDGWEEHGCSICLEIFDETNPYAPTRCGHEFHLQCIMEWLQRSCKCPLCIRVVEFLEDAEAAQVTAETLPEEDEVATLVTAGGVVEILLPMEAEVALVTAAGVVETLPEEVNEVPPTLVTANGGVAEVETEAANAGALLAEETRNVCETHLSRCPSAEFNDLCIPKLNFKVLWRHLLSKLGLH